MSSSLSLLFSLLSVIILIQENFLSSSNYSENFLSSSNFPSIFVFARIIKKQILPYVGLKETEAQIAYLGEFVFDVGFKGERIGYVDGKASGITEVRKSTVARCELEIRKKYFADNDKNVVKDESGSNNNNNWTPVINWSLPVAEKVKQSSYSDDINSCIQQHNKVIVVMVDDWLHDWMKGLVKSTGKVMGKEDSYKNFDSDQYEALQIMNQVRCDQILPDVNGKLFFDLSGRFYSRRSFQNLFKAFQKNQF